MTAPHSQITEDHIRWAYRLFLDREPENEAVLKRYPPDTMTLRRELFSSAEFQEKNRALSPSLDKWVIYQTRFGFRIFVALNEFGVSRPILMDEYETPAVRLFQRLVKPGHRVLDVGANIGFYSLLFAQLVGPSGLVQAFEPVKYLHDAARASIAENDFDSRCRIAQSAVSDQPGRTYIRHAIGTTNFGGGHLSAERRDDGHAYDTVDVRVLTEFMSEGRWNLLKVDVEGAEARVLKGGAELIRRDRPVVFAELFESQLQQVSGCGATELIQFMSDLRYRCFEIDDNGEPGAELTGHPRGDLINVLFQPS